MLQVFIIHQFTLFCIHQKHFPGTEAVFLHHLCLVNVNGPHLRGKDHISVLRDIIPGRPQAVPVKDRAQHIPVRKQDGGRAVPWFHHGGVIPVKILNPAIHVLVILPGGRNGDHHGQGQVHAAHHHEFQRIVQHGGVRAFLADDGQNLVHVIFKILRLHVFLTGSHLIRIAPDGVDLAVMHDKTVWVGAHPAGICIGAEPGVDNGNGGPIILIL